MSEQACKCGDCYHPAFGPDTDGEPCDWCRDCGCPSADHAAPDSTPTEPSGHAEPAPWIAFPGKVPVCQDCGTDWTPVRRGECIQCGSDAGPLARHTTDPRATARNPEPDEDPRVRERSL